MLFIAREWELPVMIKPLQIRGDYKDVEKFRDDGDLFARVRYGDDIQWLRVEVKQLLGQGNWHYPDEFPFRDLMIDEVGRVHGTVPHWYFLTNPDLDGCFFIEWRKVRRHARQQYLERQNRSYYMLPRQYSKFYKMGS